MGRGGASWDWREGSSLAPGVPKLFVSFLTHDRVLDIMGHRPFSLGGWSVSPCLSSTKSSVLVRVLAPLPVRIIRPRTPPAGFPSPLGNNSYSTKPHMKLPTSSGDPLGTQRGIDTPIVSQNSPYVSAGVGSVGGLSFFITSFVPSRLTHPAHSLSVSSSSGDPSATADNRHPEPPFMSRFPMSPPPIENP